MTAGLNYRPHTNLVFRPEVRYDWSNDLDTNLTAFGTDLIFTF